MRVRVLFFGPLADRFGRREEVIELPEPARARDVYAHYLGLDPDLGELGRHLLLAINQEFTSPDAPLRDRDEIALLPPMSGGAPDAGAHPAVWLSITRQPIDPASLRDRVRAPAAGAIVCFDGVVRDHSGTRSTRHLHYEAYESLALKQMHAIVQAALERWPLRGVALQHRIGELQIGESSVFIAVSAAHRQAAFEACSFIIDTLKRSVPIWKKEYFTDGSEWVEGQLPQLGVLESAEAPATSKALSDSGNE